MNSQALTTTKPGTAPPAPSRIEADLVAAYFGALEAEGGRAVLPASRALPAASRVILERRLDVLREGMRRGEIRGHREAIAKRVGQLFLRFPSARIAEGDARATLAVYAQDLESFPFWAIERAIGETIRKGEQYAPSSPALRAEAERQVAAAKAEGVRIRAILDAPIVAEVTAEQRAERRAILDGLVAELKTLDPFERSPVRPYAEITPAEAAENLERLRGQPMPKLSNLARKTMGLGPIEGGGNGK